MTEDWYFVSHRLPLAVAAKDAGYDVSIVTRVRQEGETILAAGLRLVPFENFRSGMSPIQELYTLVRLVRLYRRERPHVVHHVALKPVLYGSIAARLARVPHVINALAGMGWLFTSNVGLALWLKPPIRWMLKRLLRRGIVLLQNPDDARLLVQSGVSESRIRQIAGSGVDLQRFAYRSEPQGTPIVVFPARLLWDKGVGEFVEAARRLRREAIAARFVLVGAPDPDNPSSVSTDQIASWVREGAVEHAGWVKDMPKLLAESHIVCLPSYREGMPKSLLEAAAVGRPIVTSDAPGCREIVHHGENGLLVPPRDGHALAAALARLIKDPALRRRMGAQGRIRAEQEFNLESVIEKTLAVYAEVLR